MERTNFVSELEDIKAEKAAQKQALEYALEQIRGFGLDFETAFISHQIMLLEKEIEDNEHEIDQLHEALALDAATDAAEEA